MDENLLAVLAGRYALGECPEWRGLLRLLDYSEDFAFVPLIVPDAAGAEVCRRALDEYLSSHGKILVPLELVPGREQDQPAQALFNLSIPSQAAVVWAAPEANRWSSEAGEFEDRLWPIFSRHLNQARDPLRANLRIPLILVGSEKLRENLIRHAPDFWSIRDTVVRPEPREKTTSLLPTTGQRELPLDLPELPPATGDLDETLHEINRLQKKSPHSPALPTLLKRAGRLAMDRFLWEQAEDCLTRALEWEEVHGAHFTERIFSHDLLRYLFTITANHERGIFHARRALEIARSEYPDSSPEVARCMSNLAHLLQAVHSLSEAEPLMREALRIDRAAFGDDHPTIAIDLNNLAQLLKETNRLTEAEPMMREALRIERAAFGEDHPNVSRDLNNLALLLKDTLRFAEAEPLMREALRINRTAFGNAHPSVATRLNNLAGLLQVTRRFAEAEPLMREALQINRLAFGDTHPLVATHLNNLAALCKETKRLAEAESLILEALRIDRAVFGDDHPNVAVDLNTLAQILNDTQRSDEAEPLMREALRIDRAAFGDDHPSVARGLNNLAELLLETHRLKQAEPLMREALRICLRSLGPEHPDTRTVATNLKALLTKKVETSGKVEEGTAGF